MNVLLHIRLQHSNVMQSQLTVLKSETVEEPQSIKCAFIHPSVDQKTFQISH